jgi:predicted amidohydrolase YtcJ
MCAVSCPGVATLARGVLGNLMIPAFAPAVTPTGGAWSAGEEEPERAVILRGGPILTVDEANPIGEALAIRGSTIIGVGSLTEVKRHYTPGTEIVDLKGHAVLPGFVEPHLDVLGSALAGISGFADDPPFADDPTSAGDTVPAGARDAAELFAGDPDRVRELLAGTLRELAERGCTAVYYPGIGAHGGRAEHELLCSLAHSPEAPLRVRGAFTPQLATELGAAPGAGDEHYGVGGIAFRADGSIQDFAAALGEPYVKEGVEGTLEYEESQLREAMRAWHRGGWQLVVQANGDRAIEQVLRCYEALAADDPSPPGGPVHHRIESFALASDEQIARAGALGIGCSHAINDVYYFGEDFRDRVLGAERAARVHSLRRDLEQGVVSSCYSGSHGSPVDPCLSLRTATTRLMRDSDDVLGPFQQLKLDEALRTVTRNPASQVLLGDRIGVLRPGMLADLVVLDRDPRDVAPERLHELQVLETWLGGRRQRWV